MSKVESTEISIRVYSSTAEAGASVRQMDALFYDELGKLATIAGIRLEQISELNIMLSICHPISRPWKSKGSGSFDKKSGSFFASAAINYVQWVKSTWLDRVEAYADAASRAVLAVHKTKISEDNRQKILVLVGEAAKNLATMPPPKLTPVRPIFLLFDSENVEPRQISFSGPPLAAAGEHKIVKLLPEEAARYEKQCIWSEIQPTGYKLYKRLEGHLLYDEAWVHDGVVIRHWGKCGERGSTATHHMAGAEAQSAQMKTWKVEARKSGFRPIPESKHYMVTVSRSVEGFGNSGDLDQRHALEDYLNNQLGWLGMGHCDGGSGGSGSIEAHCIVVDKKLAVSCLPEIIKNSPFSDFTVECVER